MDPALRDAVLGAGSVQTPTSPLGDFPELSKLYESSFQLPVAGGAAGILANQATQEVENQKKAEAAKKDKGKYQRVKKSDGGFAFYDSEGNEISAYDYANATGTIPSDVLADSENPIDSGYKQDYKSLQEYINAKLNSQYDSEAATTAKQIEDQVKEKMGIDLARLTPEQVISRFKEAYPTVYGKNKNTAFSSKFGGEAGRGVPLGRTFLPPAGSIDLLGGGSDIGL
jgi:hypothetical protein